MKLIALFVIAFFAAYVAAQCTGNTCENCVSGGKCYFVPQYNINGQVLPQQCIALPSGVDGSSLTNGLASTAYCKFQQCVGDYISCVAGGSYCNCIKNYLSCIVSKCNELGVDCGQYSEAYCAAWSSFDCDGSCPTGGGNTNPTSTPGTTVPPFCTQTSTPLSGCNYWSSCFTSSCDISSAVIGGGLCAASQTLGSPSLGSYLGTFQECLRTRLVSNIQSGSNCINMQQALRSSFGECSSGLCSLNSTDRSQLLGFSSNSNDPADWEAYRRLVGACGASLYAEILLDVAEGYSSVLSLHDTLLAKLSALAKLAATDLRLFILGSSKRATGTQVLVAVSGNSNTTASAASSSIVTGVQQGQLNGTVTVNSASNCGTNCNNFGTSAPTAPAAIAQLSLAAVALLVIAALF